MMLFESKTDTTVFLVYIVDPSIKLGFYFHVNNKIQEYCGRVIIIENEFKIKTLKMSFECIRLFESALKVFMQLLKWFYVHNNTKNSRTITLFILPSFRLYVSISFEIHQNDGFFSTSL